MDDPARKRKHRRERLIALAFIVIASSVLGGVLWWKEQQTAALRDQTYIPQPVKMTPELELLRDYVRIDTSTPAGAAKGAQWVAAQLRRHGIEPELIESAPQRINVYARVKGRSRGDGLMLFHHIDVVPPGKQTWTASPFEARIIGDQLHGRGTLDMKGVAICQLLAFIDAARAATPPAHDLVFLATPDEETGSEFGMQWLLANRPDVFEGIRYGITEGGVTEIMRERMTYFGIEVGGKHHVEFTVVGDDLEAMRAARFALEPLMFPREPERLMPEVAEYMRIVAPTRMASRPYLADIEATIREGQFWRLPATYRDLLQNTVGASGPTRKNGRWSMTITLLNLPNEDPDVRVAAIMRVLAPFGLSFGEFGWKEGRAPISRWDTPLFGIIAREAQRRFDAPAGPQILYRSATDSRFLRPRGIICYGVAPYRVTYYESISIHQVNERVRIPAFQDGIAFMREVVAAWARGTA